MIKKTIEIVRSWSSQYYDMALELKERGYNHVKTFYFLSYFTLGFAFFKSGVLNQHDSDAIIRILFDESLLLYSSITFLTCFVFFKLFSALTNKVSLFKYPKNFFYWLADSSYEFIFGLLIVYLVGFTVSAPVSVNSIPWLDLSNGYIYVLFVLSVIFFVISFGLLFFVDKQVRKKSKSLKILFTISLIFFVAAALINIKS